MTCVITGDIINSRSDTANSWIPLLKTILNQYGTSPKDWEIFRGDSFQIELKRASEALLFAIKVKAILKTIKKVDVRLGIGIGTKNFVTDTITEANGEAFINSGYAFDHLLKKQNIAIKTPWKDFDDTYNTSLGLALLIMDNWTVSSSEFISMYLNNPNLTQKIISKQLQISESSASERKTRSGINEILRYEKNFKHTVIKRLKQS